jgi:hypothetical protein
VPALAYDWLYDDLSAQTKQDIAALYSGWWSYHNGSSVYYHDSWNNHAMEEVSGYMFGTTALYGDGLVDAEVATNLNISYDKLHNEYLKSTNLAAGGESIAGIDGGWAEGSYYWRRGAYAFLENCYAWSTATDDNIMDDAITLKTLSKWLLNMERSDYTLARFGDGYAVQSRFPDDANASVIYYMLAKTFGDSYSRYLWNGMVGRSSYGNTSGILNTSGTMLSSSYGNLYSYYVIFNNDVASLADLSSEPLVNYFDGMDMVDIRSGWGADDFMFLYKHNDRMTGHDHFDAGSFEISKGGVGLAVDSGAYEGGTNYSPYYHSTRYYARTIAHNLITVFDPNEIWDDYYNYLDNNDGGQKWSGAANGGVRPDIYEDFKSNSRWDRGGILKYETTDEYTYFLGDVTPAYSLSDGSDSAITNSSKMEKYYREIVYIGDKYFVIFDNVKTSAAGFIKRWLLHTVNEPSISDNLITATNGNYKLGIKALMPDNKNIIKRGGSGYEYWTNYDGTGLNALPHSSVSSPNEPGTWRIEISPAEENYQDMFLNVLEPMDAGDNMPEIVKIESDNIVGVNILDSGENKVAIFNNSFDKNASMGTISYSLAPTTQNVNHVLFNLKANTKYAVDIYDEGRQFSIAENINGSATSTDKGTLTFTSVTSSMQDIISPSAPTGLSAN